MFDHKTKKAWQGVAPGPELKERVLARADKPAPAAAFPGKRLVRATAAAAACLALALTLLWPRGTLVEINGQAVRQSVQLTDISAFSRGVMPLSLENGITVELTVDRRVEQLMVTEGTVTREEDGRTLWTVEEPGHYILSAKRGGRTESYMLWYSDSAGCWNIDPIIE